MKSENISEKPRAIVLVVDGCGIGAAPDAREYGDESDCNTLANVAESVGGLSLPNMERLGLGNIHAIRGVARSNKPLGIYGKLEETSHGKDTQTGHWEMMGVINTSAFPLFPQGFPPEIIEEFMQRTGAKGVLCNLPESGTKVIAELGEEHQRTGFPIVYTSGDSVFQIACHVDTIPLAKQYEWCEIARKMLDGPYRVGRVICRPFSGSPGNYTRLSGERRDYAVPPPSATFLEHLLERGTGVFGVGKIEDIFVGQGISHARHTASNLEGLEITCQALTGSLDLNAIKTDKSAPEEIGLIFTNLVDTDSLYGHRRNPSGYAGALTEIDNWLGKILDTMSTRDLLIISSDHGNDPTAPGTDHTREYVPLLAYSPSLAPNNDVGVRHGFCDIAASISDWLEADWTGAGQSFVPAQSPIAHS